MKKTIQTLTLSLIASTSAHASVATDLLSSMLESDQTTAFSAINHVVITDNLDLPFGQGQPSPGDTFIATGYSILGANINGAELTASYSIAGAFTGFDPSTGKLFFNHGTAPGATNQMSVYMDTAQNADDNDASSFTDGQKIATFEIVPDGPTDAAGHFTSVGGADKLTFKLIDSEREQLGITDQDVLFKINTEILLADVIDDMVLPFNFGAFDCGGFNPFDSCSREIGTGKLSLGLAELPVVIPPSDVPLPPALILFLTGFGTLGWLGKRTA